MLSGEIALKNNHYYYMQAHVSLRMHMYVFVYVLVYVFGPDASVVHTSGSGQLQANPHVVGPWLSPGKPTRRTVTTMGSSDFVVGEEHMLGQSYQRNDWQTGRCGSIAFGSSHRRRNNLVSIPRCLAEVSTCRKDFRRCPRGKIRSIAPKGGLMLSSDLSPAASQEGRVPPTDKTNVVSTRRRVPTNWVSGRTLQPFIESVVAISFVPSDFLVDGEVSGLGTVQPLLTLNLFSTWILPLHVVSCCVSTLKSKSSSSVMDGLQRRRRSLYT